MLLLAQENFSQIFVVLNCKTKYRMHSLKMNSDCIKKDLILVNNDQSLSKDGYKVRRLGGTKKASSSRVVGLQAGTLLLFSAGGGGNQVAQGDVFRT